MAESKSLSKLQLHGKEIHEKFMREDSPLHAQQKEALNSIVDWFSDSQKKDKTAVMVMPTGTGKSGVIACLPYTLGWAVDNEEVKISKEDIDLFKPILVIAPGLTILNQLFENLNLGPESTQPFLIKLEIIKKDEKKLYGAIKLANSKNVKELNHFANQYELILSNSQKWRTEENVSNYKDLPGDMFSVVIVDEAHHLPSKQWRDIVRKFSKYAKIIFFTATPERADGKEITEDKAISTNGYAYRLTREDAIKSRLIRDVRINHLEGKEVQNQVLSEIKVCLQMKNENFRLPGDNHHTALIIAKNIGEAEKIQDLCIAFDFAEKDVAVVHSKKKDKQILNKIRANQFKVVIIVQMLLEGFDHPPFSIAGILTHIKSPVKFTQFIGRVQRIVRVKAETKNGEVEAKTASGEVETETENGEIKATIKNEYEIEDEEIIADIITHVSFKQHELFNEFKNPKIPEKEDKRIDE